MTTTYDEQITLQSNAISRLQEANANYNVFKNGNGNPVNYPECFDEDAVVGYYNALERYKNEREEALKAYFQTDIWQDFSHRYPDGY